MGHFETKFRKVSVMFLGMFSKFVCMPNKTEHDKNMF